VTGFAADTAHCQPLCRPKGKDKGWPGQLLTAVENGGAGTVSRRSKMAAHTRLGHPTYATDPNRECVGAVEDYPRTILNFERRFSSEKACRDHPSYLR
jgi:hypothetical protein